VQLATALRRDISFFVPVNSFCQSIKLNLTVFSFYFLRLLLKVSNILETNSEIEILEIVETKYLVNCPQSTRERN